MSLVEWNWCGRHSVFTPTQSLSERGFAEPEQGCRIFDHMCSRGQHHDVQVAGPLARKACGTDASPVAR
jgi:hypothetical protein